MWHESLAFEWCIRVAAYSLMFGAFYWFQKIKRLRAALREQNDTINRYD